MTKLFLFICVTLLGVGVAYSAVTLFIAVVSFALWDVGTAIEMFESLTWQGFRITLIFSAIISLLGVHIGSDNSQEDVW